MMGIILNGVHSCNLRVPDAVRHSSCRSAEPGPYQTPEFATAPALQRTAPQELRAALRPGHDIEGLRRLLRAHQIGEALEQVVRIARTWGGFRVILHGK